MTKIEIEANELRNGEIEKLSLVTHGAIRQPFKILKTEEMEGSKTGGLKKTLTNLFGQDQSQDEEKRVAALFIRKSVAKKWLPLIRKQGFRVEKEHASLEGDILVLKQEGFTDDCKGSVIALNPDVAVQLTHVSKFFDPFPASSSFADNVAAGSFWPGMHNAMDSLAETVWNVLNESDSPDDAASAVAKQIKAFSSHLNNLVAELPTTVFKMEQESLTKEFEGSNVSVSSTDTIVSNEEANMSTVVLKEASAGDLDGLLLEAPAADAALAKADAAAAEKTTGDIQLFSGDVQLTKEAFDALADDAEVIIKQEGEADKTMTKAEVAKGDEGAPKSGGSPGNPVVENTSDTGAVSLDEGGVPAGFRKEERVVKEYIDGNIVVKFAEFLINEENGEAIFVKFIEALSTPNVDVKSNYTDAENKLFEAMGVMVKGISDIKESIQKQNTRIDAVEKTADTAQETADNTVVISSAADDLGNAIATLRGNHSVRKEAAPAANTGEVVDIWKGALPGIEGNAA